VDACNCEVTSPRHNTWCAQTRVSSNVESRLVINRVLYCLELLPATRTLVAVGKIQLVECADIRVDYCMGHKRGYCHKGRVWGSILVTKAWECAIT
jgi:hypothetical protein